MIQIRFLNVNWSSDFSDWGSLNFFQTRSVIYLQIWWKIHIVFGKTDKHWNFNWIKYVDCERICKTCSEWYETKKSYAWFLAGMGGPPAVLAGTGGGMLVGGKLGGGCCGGGRGACLWGKGGGTELGGRLESWDPSRRGNGGGGLLGTG